MATVVVDTNVVLVANGRHPDVSDGCIASCAQRLQATMRDGRLALDSGFLILREYQKKSEPRNGRGPGDAFVKWALQNNANTSRVDCIDIVDHKFRGFASFPDDPDLARFDPPDRKFVAVAAAHECSPAILQAADSKWLDWATALARYGVIVEFLCKDDIARFQKNKAKR